MSIASEIARLQGVKSNILQSIADKGVEIFAGGKNHWGNDGYNVRKYVSAKWVIREQV